MSARLRGSTQRPSEAFDVLAWSMGRRNGLQGCCGAADTRTMDRVQNWRVSGDTASLPDALANALMSVPRVRRVGWKADGKKLVGRTRWTFWEGAGQKVTARVDSRASDYWDLTVCSETFGLMDYGRNLENLETFGRALSKVGFQVETSTVATSWTRKSRP
jgi:hypothetical protein